MCFGAPKALYHQVMMRHLCLAFPDFTQVIMWQCVNAAVKSAVCDQILGCCEDSLECIQDCVNKFEMI